VYILASGYCTGARTGLAVGIGEQSNILYCYDHSICGDDFRHTPGRAENLRLDLPRRKYTIF